MSGKKGNVVLVLLCVAFGSIPGGTFGRSLTGQERTRLVDSIKGRSNVPLTMDISFTKTVLTRPEVVKKRNEATMEQTRKLREKTKNESITITPVDIALPDGSEVRLSETRTRIGAGGRLRSDTTTFANMEKTETWAEETKINTGYEKDNPSYLIDHKLKQCWIRSGRPWSGYEVMRFGKTDELIAIDIAFFSDPNVKAHGNRNFLHTGKASADGKPVDEIECINLKNGRPAYRLSLDSDNWHICRRIVWFHEKSGLPSRIVEYKEFAEAKGSGGLFPHLVMSRRFDEGGKEEEVETINVTNVVTGLPITENIFELDCPDDYAVLNPSGS